MFKGSAPWDWSPDGLADDMKSHARGLISFIPAWNAGEGAGVDDSLTPVIYFDPITRQSGNLVSATGNNTVNGVVSKNLGLALDMQGTGVARGIDSGSDVLANLSEMTVISYVNTTTTTTSQSIWGNYVSGGFLWRTDSTGRMRVILTTGGVNRNVYSSNNVISINTDVCAAVRYDGANLTHFYNGVKDLEVAATGTISTGGWGNQHLGDQGTSLQPWDGHIYGVLVWNRALDDAEMRFVNDNFFRFWEPAEPRAPLFGDLGAAPSGPTIPIFAHHYNQMRLA